MDDKNKRLFVIAAFAILTIIIWQVPGGYYILYPFTILGTWFHEMGHGLTALLFGGDFYYIKIQPDGSGIAVYAGALYLGNFGRAFVAAGGPFGPTIAGALIIAATKKEKISFYLLPALGIILLLSVLFYIRSFFGIMIITLFGIIFLYISFKTDTKWKLLTLQLLGVQSCLSVYMNIGYLFSKGANIGGKQYLSDTGVMENALVLPYWFWGIMIIIFSIFLIFKSLRYVFSE
ncbi:MAG: M50 family metallopeptidase [bacterium]